MTVLYDINHCHASPRERCEVEKNSTSSHVLREDVTLRAHLGGCFDVPRPTQDFPDVIAPGPSGPTDGRAGAPRPWCEKRFRASRPQESGECARRGDLRTRHAALTALAGCALAAGALAACSGRAGHGAERGRGSVQVTVKGSDTMVILAQRWAEGFMHIEPRAVVQVSGGGSGTGIAALLGGTTHIATASRRITEDERGRLRERYGHEPAEFPVALDAVAIYVHRDNPVASLTIEQLRAIFRGRVRSWRDVGGPDWPIVLYSRENNSGTYAFFKERVLDGLDFAVEAQTLPGTAAVINAVGHDRRGIGYGGIGFGRRVRVVPIAARDGAPPVSPGLQAAWSGQYPLARRLFMYSAGVPDGMAGAFIAWVRSPAGQALVEAAGFFPVPHDESPSPVHTRVPAGHFPSISDPAHAGAGAQAQSTDPHGAGLDGAAPDSADPVGANLDGADSPVALHGDGTRHAARPAHGPAVVAERASTSQAAP
jgi:phosphate transport system substrate-binding protein